MCGFCGIFTLNGSKIDIPLLKGMTQKIRHRGPDDEGFVLIDTENNVFSNCFGEDTVDEIKKGARGGDCLQIVNTRTRQNCGKIYYESKRTKDFQSGWIEKFKADMREKGADVGVLVTEAMPSGFDRMGIMEGVWICSYEEV